MSVERGIVSICWPLVAVKVEWVVLLRPLSCKNGGWEYHKQEKKELLLLECTFQKLLAGVLLEECFVDNRLGKVINHELEDRLDLIFGIARVMR